MTEHITGYRLINHGCNHPGCSKRADIEVTYQQTPASADRQSEFLMAMLLTPISRHYCTEHSPIDIEAEKRSWMKTLQTPPGRAR